MENFEIEDNKNDNLMSKRKKKKNSTNLFSKINKIVLIITLIIMIFIVFFFIYSKNKKPKKHYIVLVGDIGGIHARLRLLNITSDINEEPIILKFSNKSPIDYESLEILLKEFISLLKPNEKPEYAVMGMPGPVENNHLITLPNIPHWKLEDGDKLGKSLGLKQFIFLNDFVCNGYAIQTNLKENIDYLILNNVQPKKDGAKLMIGPGTGLGMGFLLKNQEDRYYTIGSSEGGGRDYSPKSEFNLKLRQFIKEEVGLKNVPLGKMCSARSLIPIYKFLHLYGEKKYDREPFLAEKIDEFKSYKKVSKISEINAELIDKGLSGECQLSRATLLLFIEIFGEIAGDLALFTLPFNGVYLLGRLTRRLTPLILQNNIFMNHFKNKDHFWFLLERIPVYLIQNEYIELIGVTEAARRFLEEKELKEL
jgi:glucokinase